MKPLLRGHFHQAMFFITLGAGLTLIWKCDNLTEFLAIGAYVLCALLMFGISSLYHRINWNPEKRLLWRKLDHCGIYLMIAGTFTPVATFALPPESTKTLLITIWAVAAFGTIQSLFFVNLPKYVNAIFYLVMGYMILPYLSDLTERIGLTLTWTLIAGGLLYTVGAICYALKRPVLNPQVFSYHEVFHLFVNLGAALHFSVINSLV
jgi:hemolysin III